MSKKLISLILLVLWFLWFGIGNAKHPADASSASNIQQIKAIPIPADRVVQPFHPFTMSEERFCAIQYDDGSVVWYFPDFDSGWGFALYMDPQDCGEQDPYPFKITGVHFYLADFDSAVWPVEIRVNIRDLKKDSICLGPGTLVYHQTFKIPVDSCDSILQRPMNLGLDSLNTPSLTRCIYDSFFLEIIFTGETEAPFPSLVMGDDSSCFPDTCRAWLLKDGKYYEWFDEIWAPPTPGCPIMRIAGYTNSVDCDLCWFWKEPDTTTAPNGMPDFDQYQFGDPLANDSSALDLPTAVANCLWWFDAVPEDTTPPDLIRLLSTYFHTHIDSGTSVDSIQSGLDRYFNDYGFSLYADTFYQPNLSEMEDSLKSYQNVILILGFWQLYEDSWHRFGGHAVAMAGACSKLDSLWVGVSDPAVDGAELSWQGRFFPLGHPPHPDDHTLHNNSLYVSHDIYVSDNRFIMDDDTLWRITDFYDVDNSLFSQFQGKNFQPGQMQYYHSYEDAESVYTVVEYAIMICPKSTAVEEEEEVITFEDFQLFQNRPNPFNNETTIKYTLSKSGHVSLVIYNILGQKVGTLVHEYQKPGVKTVSWDGRDEKGKDLGSGIYFYQLSAGVNRTVHTAGSIGKVGEITRTKRMLLLK